MRTCHLITHSRYHVVPNSRMLAHVRLQLGSAKR